MKNLLITLFIFTTTLICSSLTASETTTTKLFTHEWYGKQQELSCHLTLQKGLQFDQNYSVSVSKSKQYQVCLITCIPLEATSYLVDGKELTKLEIYIQVMNLGKANELPYSISTRSYYSNTIQGKTNISVIPATISSGTLPVPAVDLAKDPEFYHKDSTQETGMALFHLVENIK